MSNTYRVRHNELHVSLANCFATCPRKYFYQFELGWRPKVTTRALLMGTAWHKLMELCADKDCESPVEALCNTPEAGDVADPYDLATLIAMGRAFVERFRDWSLQIDACEQPFSIPLGDTGWHFGGTIDAIAGSSVIEYKTTGADISEDSTYWLRLKANLQVSMYALANNLREPAIYVVARKPKFKPSIIPLLDEQGKKMVYDIATNERLYKQTPLLDDDGLKVIRDIATGERAYKKDGTPAQTAKAGVTEVVYTRGEPYQSAKDGVSYIATAQETPVQFAQRVKAEIDANPNAYFASREVDVSHLMAYDAQLTCLSIINEIEAMRRSAQMLQACGKRTDRAWRRNCTEFNCASCPYAGLCLDADYSPANGVPEGFEVVD